MAEPPFETDRPPDETWWERELNRNEKLMDKYMAELGDDPEKLRHPRDLFDKIHSEIDAPESTTRGETEEAETTDTEKRLNDVFDAAEESAATGDSSVMDEALDAAFDGDEEDEDGVDTEDYPRIAKLGLKFAVRVLKVEDIPEEAEVLYLSAGKVGANLAGGHGLGYDDESICGNIVKCRWALADCEFCREMLGHLYERTGDAEYGAICREARELAAAITDRIARLRRRVWW